jgi:ribosomal protein S18 acetylase RimI-like enzyme
MTDNPQIRNMHPADIPNCARWVAETPLWQRYGVTEQAFGERLRGGLESGATIYVAVRGHDVLGFLWLVERGVFARSDYIQLIGVHPGERGHGVGAALMEYAEAKSKGHGRELFLLVSDFNTGAQRFYERLGYRQVGRLDDYVIQGVSEYIYRKPHREQK